MFLISMILFLTVPLVLEGIVLLLAVKNLKKGLEFKSAVRNMIIIITLAGLILMIPLILKDIRILMGTSFYNSGGSGSLLGVGLYNIIGLFWCLSLVVMIYLLIVHNKGVRPNTKLLIGAGILLISSIVIGLIAGLFEADHNSVTNEKDKITNSIGYNVNETISKATDQENITICEEIFALENKIPNKKWYFRGLYHYKLLEQYFECRTSVFVRLRDVEDCTIAFYNRIDVKLTGIDDGKIPSLEKPPIDEGTTESCITAIAIDTKNVSWCKKLKQYAPNCLKSLGVAASDIEICEQINDSFEKVGCRTKVWNDLADANLDMNYCEKIEKSVDIMFMGQNDCKIRILHKLAQKTLDITYCYHIGNIIGKISYLNEQSYCLDAVSKLYRERPSVTT